MKHRRAALVSLLLLLPVGSGFVGWYAVHKDSPPERATEVQTNLQSPRLVALAKELEAGDSGAVRRFWKEVDGHSPLVERVAGEVRQSWVTFLWRGDSTTRRIGVVGGPPAEGRTLLTRLGSSDVWYRTELMSNDARLVYSFYVNVPDARPADPAAFAKMMEEFPPQRDPLNPREYEGRSLLELPAAPTRPWVRRHGGIGAGRVVERTMRSDLLNQARVLRIYTPTGYDAAKEACGLLIVFDGPGLMEDPATLDNLIVEGKVTPLVAVFIKHVDRAAELGCSPAFADFLANELVPWMRREYRVSPDPKRTIIRGLSLGGLMASYCALRRPDVFGNVLSQSGSYQWFPEARGGTVTQPPDAEPGWLTRQFVVASKSDVAFYVEAGRFEHFHPYNLLAENRRFRDVLRAKGYTVHYAEFTGGHDPVNWRGSFADGLIALAGTPAK